MIDARCSRRPATSRIDAGVLEALAAGTAASPMVADGTTGPDDLAVAALPKHGATLLVGRDGHPFRRRERAAARRARGHRRPRLELLDVLPDARSDLRREHGHRDDGADG